MYEDVTRPQPYQDVLAQNPDAHTDRQSHVTRLSHETGEPSFKVAEVIAIETEGIKTHDWKNLAPISARHGAEHEELGREVDAKFDSRTPDQQRAIGVVMELGQDTLSNDSEVAFLEQQKPLPELSDGSEVTKQELLYALVNKFEKIEQVGARGETGINMKGLAYLHGQFENLASGTDIFQSRVPNEIQLADRLINRYVQAIREYIITNPFAKDLLASDTENSRKAFCVYLAVESAVAGDFDTARGRLLDMAGHQSPLETALLVRLEEAELDRKVTVGKVTPEISTTNMQRLGIHASEEAIRDVEHADPHITIGTSITTLMAMLSSGRFMTTGEIYTISSGAEMHSADEKRRGRVNQLYNENRSRVELALGHTSNPFLPKVIYGALTSDLQADRGNGYGKVTLHLSSEVTNDPSTTYTIGDSLPPSRGLLEASKAKSQQVTPDDALIAYASRLHSKGSVFNGNYIEAHVVGVDLGKIDKASVVVTRPEPGVQGELKYTTDAIEDCIDRGIKTEAIIDLRSWNLQKIINKRIDTGMTEDEAVRMTVQRLRSNFGIHRDSPLLSLVFVFSDDAELPANHHAYHGSINRDLFAKYGVIIREPNVGSLLEGKRS